ncbi:MAG: HD domain-containing protein [Gemmatimonadetes bacterium]|nr:HD domain-containing protein [Gemmatimonadota bacterium]
MAKTRKTRARPPQANSTTEDPVLSHLDEAKRAYRARRSEWEHRESELSVALEGREAELEQTRREVAQLEDRTEELSLRVDATEARLQAEREESARQHERAEQLTRLLKEIHRALFSGDVYDLILRACLTITGATRGLYVTWKKERDTPRIRAAVGIDGYPASPPSAFVQALCGRVLEDHRSLVCSQDGLSDLPEPASADERFRNCVVTPVVLLRDFDGIVIAADKEDGEFSEADVEALLSVGDQAAVAVQNMHLERELQNAYISTVSMLADAVEAKDPYTHGHCEMASRYARMVADRLQLSDYDRSVVCYSALLHDVGKIGVSDGVLNKPGPLLPEERELMRAHVRVGYELLRNVPALQAVADVVLHHHEWYDGSGYPDGMKGEEIPIAARIVSAVDAYCAMTTRRSYKEAYTEEHARSELQRCAGTQFDPQVVEILLSILSDPDSHDWDDDWSGECGVLPDFTQFRELRDML